MRHDISKPADLDRLRMDVLAGSEMSEGEPDLLAPDLNDNGNAERLIRLHGSTLRYCHGFRKWLWYDGRRWAIDDTDQARRLVKDAMIQTARQANTHRAEAVLKWATRSLDHRRLTSALSLAECEIFVRPAELDRHPDLLNFLNGTVNLRTGELLVHDPQHFITKLVRHRYRPDAECPLWLAFMARIMGAHADASEAELDAVDRLIGYLQRAKGYSLTGHTSEKAVFVPFGGGNNGKTTMLSVFAGSIAEYATSIQADTLMVRQESNNSQADLADLRGARFVQTSETEQGQRLAQGKLKRITQGMGVIKAVRKYENPIVFPETHKLWLDTNRKPLIRDTDDKATFNRLHPIPFTVTIPDAEIDRELPSKLRAEAEGILAWAVEGARQWYAGGLQRPTEIDNARQAWRDEDDQIGRWIEERCTTGEGYIGKAEDLYDDYKRWTDASGERERLSNSVFSQRLKNRGHKNLHKDTGNLYIGITLGLRV
jgi:putative DNA primase/helicase